jgi:hypothetical protein
MQNFKDSSVKIKIGEYVRYQMQLLTNKNKLSNEDIEKLQDLNYCKTEFNITFCVLIDQKLSVKDDKGYPRYYANDLFFNNYRLTSQWKESHRKPFLRWLKKHGDVEDSNQEPSASNTILQIELIPSNNHVFIEALLKTKSATITTFYKNGTNDSKIWNASKMDRKSNVIGNLRSRLEFRNGNWQKANIVKVVVEVNNNLSGNPILEKKLKINPIKTNTMTKESAIQLVNKKLNLNLNSNNTNWSNINSNGIWSIEPNCERRAHKLYLLLNNNRSNRIHVFEIPANDLVYNKLYSRNDKNVYRLLFKVSDSEFSETLKNIDFIKFHKGSIDIL